jgi:hypothetical protein
MKPDPDDGKAVKAVGGSCKESHQVEKVRGK